MKHLSWWVTDEFASFQDGRTPSVSVHLHTLSHHQSTLCSRCSIICLVNGCYNLSHIGITCSMKIQYNSTISAGCLFKHSIVSSFWSVQVFYLKGELWLFVSSSLSTHSFSKSLLLSYVTCYYVSAVLGFENGFRLAILVLHCLSHASWTLLPPPMHTPKKTCSICTVFNLHYIPLQCI
jgi:hypothetical protein